MKQVIHVLLASGNAYVVGHEILQPHPSDTLVGVCVGVCFGFLLITIYEAGGKW